MRYYKNQCSQLAIWLMCLSFLTAKAVLAAEFPEAEAILEEYQAEADKISSSLEGMDNEPTNIEWVQTNLSVMFDLDQLARTTSHRYVDLEDEAAEWFLLEISSIIEDMFTAHMGLYQELLDANGWFDISRFGSEADYHGWYFAQHDDMAAEKRAEILEVLKTRVNEGETSPGGFANLSDIVALEKGDAQIYGTLGACDNEGNWVPEPIADEEELANLRENMELPDFDEFLREMNRICSAY